MSEENSFHISGVPIKFPVKPYPSQVAMMSQILRGVKNRENCLLESPTGTGKSLALLCSTLSWQAIEEERVKRYNALINQGIRDPDILDQIWRDKISSSEDTLETSAFTNEANESLTLSSFSRDSSTANIETEGETVPHEGGFIRGETAQDLRMGNELGDSFNANERNASNPPNQPRRKKAPKIYFGTRTHKQIFQIIRELRKTDYKNVRSTVLASREHTCIHPTVSKSKSKDEKCKALLQNKDDEFCSYYHGASRIKNQDQLLSHGLQPAWDLEDMIKAGRAARVCPFFATRNLVESSQIIFCPYNYLIDPLIRESMNIDLRGHILVLDEAHNIEDCSRSAASCSFTQDRINDAKSDLEKLLAFDYKPNSCQPLIQMLSNLSLWMESNKDKLTDYQEFGRSGKIISGRDMVKHLSHIDIDSKSLSLYEKCLGKLNEENDGDKTTPKPSSATSQLLSGFFLILSFLFKNDSRHVDDYKAALVKSQNFFTPETVRDDEGWINTKRRSKKYFVYNLHFWCLNPGVAFSDIGAKARSIILASGTLSPLNSFESELDIKFNIKFEANHIIKKEQVFVRTISRGPKNFPLNASFKHSETWAFQDELGRLILELCKAITGGILCFVPSYAMIDKLLERWKTSMVWDQIGKIKHHIVESRNSEDFEKSMKMFNEFVETTRNAQEGEISGALYIAVCRGKVSEGLDFSDDKARAVIAVGIPFPNRKDIQVNLKREYNSMYSKSRGLLTGSEWYEIQAYRALNQALGRCIRHRYDWGALLLVDERFQENSQGCNRYLRGLSKWVRNCLQHEPSFTSVISHLKEFSHKMINCSQITIVEDPKENALCKLPVNVNKKFSTPPVLQEAANIMNFGKAPNSKETKDNYNNHAIGYLHHQNSATQPCHTSESLPSIDICSASPSVKDAEEHHKEKNTLNCVVGHDSIENSYIEDEDLSDDMFEGYDLDSTFDRKSHPQGDEGLEATRSLLPLLHSERENEVPNRKRTHSVKENDPDLEDFNLDTSFIGKTSYPSRTQKKKRKHKKKLQKES